jgi:hypothetical protein
MWISIRARRLKVSQRLRETIQRYIERKLHRERTQVASVAVYLSSRTLASGEEQITCRLVLWSHWLGKVAVSEVSTTVRRAVREATLRAREVVRRNVKRRITRNRRLGRNRLHRYFEEMSEV